MPLPLVYIANYCNLSQTLTKPITQLTAGSFYDTGIQCCFALVLMDAAT